MSRNFQQYWLAVKDMTMEELARYSYNARDDDFQAITELQIYVLRLKDQLKSAGIEPLR